MPWFKWGHNDRESDGARLRTQHDADWPTDDADYESDQDHRGRHNPHTDSYNELGLTEHQQAVLDAWIMHGVTDGARLLGMNKHTFKQTAENAREKLGIDNYNRNEAYKYLKGEGHTPEYCDNDPDAPSGNIWSHDPNEW